MNTNEFIELRRVTVFALKDCTALFLCCDKKTILIQTEIPFCENAVKAMEGRKNPRPQTYELLATVCRSLDAQLVLAVITDFRDGVYFARMVYEMKNELGQKLVEIDARPSDAVLQALQMKAKIFIAPKVFEQAEDASPLLEKLQERESKNS